MRSFSRSARALSLLVSLAGCRAAPDAEVAQRDAPPVLEYGLVVESGVAGPDTIQPPFWSEAEQARERFVVSTPLWNARVERARMSTDDTGRPAVTVEFVAEDRDSFAQITAAHAGKQFAFLVDGKLTSAPYVEESLRGSIQVRCHECTEAEFALLLDRLTP